MESIFSEITLALQIPEQRLALGIFILTVFMTVLKSDGTGDVFSKIPKAYKSFVPYGFAFILSCISSFLDPIFSEVKDVLIGTVVIGSMQMGAYQSLKGLPIGALIVKLLKTQDNSNVTS